MLIANKNSVLRFLLLILVLVISMRNLQLIPKADILSELLLFVPKPISSFFFGDSSIFHLYKYIDNDNNISFLYFFSKSSQFCLFRWRDLEFSIPDCENIKLGSIFRISGSIGQVIANQENGQKRLLIQSIKSVNTFDDSDISLFDRTIVILSPLLRALSTYRIFLRTGMEESFSPPTYSFLAAMMLGDKSLLEESTRHIFKITGSLHVLAVSGMHLSLLFDMLQRASSRFQRIVRIFSQVVLIILYSIMVGGGASVFRALGMVLFRIIGSSLLYRQIHAGHSLFVVVVVMLMLNSWYLTQVGFQLSVCATGIIIGYLIFKKKISAVKMKHQQNSTSSDQDMSRWAVLMGSLPSEQSELPNSIEDPDLDLDLDEGTDLGQQIKKLSVGFVNATKEYLKETVIIGIVIQVFLAPLLWWHFGEVSWVGVLAGPASLWLVPPLFLCTFMFIGLYTCIQAISSISTLFQSLFILVPLSYFLKILVLFLQFILLFINLAIEIFSTTFLFILSQLTVLTQDWALLIWPDFGIQQSFLWYTALVCFVYAYSRYLTRKNTHA